MDAHNKLISTLYVVLCVFLCYTLNVHLGYSDFSDIQRVFEKILKALLDRNLSWAKLKPLKINLVKNLSKIFDHSLKCLA
jgi:hypothetical protein